MESNKCPLSEDLAGAANPHRNCCTDLKDYRCSTVEKGVFVS